LAEQVEAGEEVIIARAGKPFMKLVPYTPPKRIPGQAKDLFKGLDQDIGMGIDPEIQEMFFGPNWQDELVQ
jgi:antitoxin (DNA-binding transcriptional repressor) of toxin-antitoxin stability system